MSASFFLSFYISSSVGFLNRLVVLSPSISCYQFCFFCKKINYLPENLVLIYKEEHHFWFIWYSVAIIFKLQKLVLWIITKAMLKSRNTEIQYLEKAVQSEMSVGSIQAVRFRPSEHEARKYWKMSNWITCSFLESRMKMRK